MKRNFFKTALTLCLGGLFFFSCSEKEEVVESVLEVSSVAIVNSGEDGATRAEGVLDGSTFNIQVSPLSDLTKAQLEIVAPSGIVTTPANGTVVDFEANNGEQSLVASKGSDVKTYTIKVTKSELTDELVLKNLVVTGVYNPVVEVLHAEKTIKISCSNVTGTNAVLSGFELNPATATIKETVPALISGEEGDYMEVDLADASEKYIVVANGSEEKKYTIVAEISKAGFDASTANIVLDQSLGSGLNAVLGTNNTRGAYFDGRYAFFASREGGNNIYYYDINDATKELKSLNMGEGVLQTNTTWAISDVRVSETGGIYACSMANAKDKNFAVYYWSDVNATPVKVLDYVVSDPVGESTAVRLGDALSIVGDPQTNGYIMTSNFPFQNTSQGQFYIWKATDGTLATEPQVIDLVGKYQAPSASDLSLGQYARINGVPGDSEHFIASSSAVGILVLNKDFDIEFELQRDTPIQGRAMDPHLIEYNGVRYLSYTVNREWAANEAFVEIVALSEGDNFVDGLKSIAEKSMDEVRAYNKPITTNASAGATWVSACNNIKEVNGKLYLFGFVCEYGAIVVELSK